ncbi:MAG: 2-amino-4-hydroxy-6-hydroxymethyldihydropteridine diphosphokinase [Wenzhouxiangellaceae bacterium]|nr:2-amino-4-hydroxy-6-hydroxymethyldihydropteridine diphosphokinase [Wenzhouxiangellaceae bacterium]
MANVEEVYLGLGSNLNARRMIAAGIQALERRFGHVDCSPVYRSPAVGFSGDDFLNACCRIETDLDPEALKAWLTELEDAHGRRRDLPKFADRTLDIDILLHGDRVGRFGDLDLPRGEILKYAHVLKPLADLAPELTHPQTGTTFAEHWRAFDGDHTLERVDI